MIANNGITLLPWQVQPANHILSRLAVKKPTMLVAPTRTGKSYTIAEVLRRAQAEFNYFKDPAKPVTILILTKKSVKIQWTRVLKQAGVEQFLVESYSAMVSSLGEMLFIEWISRLKHGVMSLIPVWNKEMMPDIIILDEVQSVKNPEAQCSLVIESYIEQGGLAIPVSATPFIKIAEAYICCIALHYSTKFSWPSDAKEVAWGNPNDWNAEAIKRLNDALVKEGMLVKHENITWKHRTINHCVLTDFETPKHRELYNKAYDTFLEECAKIGRDDPDGVVAKWIAQLKFRQVSELYRSNILARMGVEQVRENGRQIIIASNFIPTLRAVWNCLVKKHGVKQDAISFIIGGQSDKLRQSQIDKFQNAKSLFLITTLKAGGVGISLHHDRKCSLPRHVLLPPTWSAYELVQMLGRAHGPTSLSTTHQEVVWFKDTIEEEVAARVELKMRCLKEIVTKRETWIDLFTKRRDESTIELSRKLADEQEDTDSETGEKIIYDVEGLVD